MMVSQVLLVLGCVVYLAATVAFVMHFFRDKQTWTRRGVRVLKIGLLLHLAGEISLGIEHGAIPVTNSFESLNVLALLVVVTFVIVSRRYAVPVLGAFVSPLVMVTLAASMAFGQFDGVVPDVLRSAWFPVHLGFAMSANAFFAVAGVTSVAYLIQESMLRQKSIGVIFRKLPPLHVLDEIGHRLIVLGWASLTVGMVAGVFYAKQKWGAYWQWDPKQIWVLATWLLFAGVLHARITVGWQGRRVVFLTLITVLVVLAAAVSLETFFVSRHAGEYV
jgi:cytochrome c-type biogenesis protein CcsB